MADDFLAKFRHQLFEWLQLRLSGGRLPFRRIEKHPPVMTAKGQATPDLVLWINRDSLLAGAMILIPSKADRDFVQHGAELAGSLGLKQFVTWEARAVNLWEVGQSDERATKSWPLPAARVISADDFAITFEQLLHELKLLAVSAMMPVEQLPPAYFANLCLQTLRDVEPALQAAARVACGSGQTDSDLLRQACDKGWLTLWRLLTLLQHNRIPPGVKPERLDRALGYALAELDQQEHQLLVSAANEPPLPEEAAIRFHHLAGRLAQLGWHQQPVRTAASLQLLFSEAARGYCLESTPIATLPAGTLLVNHLPLTTPAESFIIAPRPCLAGWLLATGANGAGRPARTYSGVAALPADIRPAHIIAVLTDLRPLPAAQRRERLTALRQPWPYRRLQFPGETPAWLWDALHLAGLADPEGRMELTLPAAWATASGADLFWKLLTERLSLASLQLHGDGRQTLTLCGHEQAPEHLMIRQPDGTACQTALLFEDSDVSALTALATTAFVSPPASARPRKNRPALAERIASQVFRDGLPRFPDHYLRRIDLPPLRTYHLPGPLQIDSHFFDRVRLTAPDGTIVDSDNPAEAEALVLASRDGRRRVDLPVDPVLTLRLTAAYRDDLLRLWQNLLDECRRHHSVQRHALALARRLWRERNLPAVENH